MSEQDEEIEAICIALKETAWAKRLKFNPWQLARYYKKHNKHPKAILHVLRTLQKNGPHLNNSVWPYANRVMAVEHQNYNERDQFVHHRQTIKDIAEFIGKMQKER